MLFKDGVIENVIIDDYVPAFKGMPLFLGPVYEKEVFPMLIEKALAKVFGSYENVPEDTETIMEALFCGPARKINMLGLKEKGNNELYKVITDALNS